jgi:hypothetical protein
VREEGQGETLHAALRRVSGRAAAACAAALLALGAGACGDEEDSENRSAPAAQEQRGGSAQGAAKGDQRDGAEQGGSGEGGPTGETSAEFTPRSHEDSGGGSAQLRVPGADNSVQGFGDEAGGSEFEAAAAALHNFYDARAQRAWAAACTELSTALAASLEGRVSPDAEPRMSCARGLEQMTNPQARELQREEAQIDVASLRAEGDQGFLLYRDAEGTIYAIGVQREGGEWKLTSLAGLPLS